MSEVLNFKVPGFSSALLFRVVPGSTACRFCAFILRIDRAVTAQVLWRGHLVYRRCKLPRSGSCLLRSR